MLVEQIRTVAIMYLNLATQDFFSRYKNAWGLGIDRKIVSLVIEASFESLVRNETNEEN